MSKRELFSTEQATHDEDLPHQFSESQASAFACEVCGLRSGEPRHVAWEKARVHGAERAHQSRFSGLVREFGS